MSKETFFPKRNKTNHLPKSPYHFKPARTKSASFSVKRKRNEIPTQTSCTLKGKSPQNYHRFAASLIPQNGSHLMINGISEKFLSIPHLRGSPTFGKKSGSHTFRRIFTTWSGVIERERERDVHALIHRGRKGNIILVPKSTSDTRVNSDF